MRFAFIGAAGLASVINMSVVAQEQALPSTIDAPGSLSGVGPSLGLDPTAVDDQLRSGPSARSGRDAAEIGRIDFAAMASLDLEFQASTDPAAGPTAGMAGPGASATTEAGAWRIDLTAYVWVPIRMDGTSSVAGTSVPIDFTIGDVFDKFDPIGFAGRVEAWHDDTFGFIFDGNYVHLKSKGFELPTMPPTPFDLTIEQAMVDVAGGWRFFKHSPSDDNPGSRIWADLIGGVRWQYLKEEIDLSGGPTLGGSEDWFEPLIGARFVWQLNDEWAFMVRGDASGFGVGNASDLTWNLMGGAAWSISDRFTLQFAYKFQSIDYDNDARGPDQIGIDMDLHGPYVGFSFSF